MVVSIVASFGRILWRNNAHRPARFHFYFYSVITWSGMLPESAL